MKKLTTLILSGFTIYCGCLIADDDAIITGNDVGSEEMHAAQEDGKERYQVAIKTDWIPRAKIDKRGHRHQHVKFGIVDVEASALVYYNQQCGEGIRLGVGYDGVYFNWNKNPNFHEKTFNQVSFSIAAFTKRTQGWLWQAQATLNWEPKYSNFSHYTNYDLLLWGRYDLCPDYLGFHCGFVALTGMKIDKIFPIIGIDWTVYPKWKLNLIFPLNLSVVYTINKNWSAALAGRFFQVRERFGKHGRPSRGLFQYRNNGVELAANYAYKKMNANFHVGSTFGGQFKISNNHNKKKEHYDLCSAFYLGGEASLDF